MQLTANIYIHRIYAAEGREHLPASVTGAAPDCCQLACPYRPPKKHPIFLAIVWSVLKFLGRVLGWGVLDVYLQPVYNLLAQALAQLLSLALEALAAAPEVVLQVLNSVYITLQLITAVTIF